MSKIKHTVKLDCDQLIWIIGALESEIKEAQIHRYNHLPYLESIIGDLKAQIARANRA